MGIIQKTKPIAWFMLKLWTTNSYGNHQPTIAIEYKMSLTLDRYRKNVTGLYAYARSNLPYTVIVYITTQEHIVKSCHEGLDSSDEYFKNNNNKKNNGKKINK